MKRNMASKIKKNVQYQKTNSSLTNKSFAIEKAVILKKSLLLIKLFERFYVVSWSVTWNNFAVLKNKFSLPIIKKNLRAKIRKSIVQRRKVKCQFKVCQIEKLKISLNRVRQDRHFLVVIFFNSIISFRNNIRKWKKNYGKFRNW